MVSKTEAIKRFLIRNDCPQDLEQLYEHNMEVQVSIEKGEGELVEGEFKGIEWRAYRDPVSGQIYKPFRIPYGAKTENPHFDDPPMKYDLSKHASHIGMTGWDWYNQVSKWVGFDFDSIVGHKEGLSEEDLESVREAVSNLDYVTLRKSTSGNGYHVYVFLDDVHTVSHTEHSALARAVLSKMCTDTGYDLKGKVDCFGSVLWIWARKMEGTDGLSLIKQGGVLMDIPPNWKDHVQVIKRKVHKIRPDALEDKDIDPFEALIKERVSVPLDDVHRQIIEYLNTKTNAHVEWNADQGMLITHTSALKKAHDDLVLRGQFETVATGSEQGDKNCYCFPMRNGEWAVRRFSRGIVEAPTWTLDSSGWTRCYLNRKPDLETACRAHGGVEHTDGSFVFEEAIQAVEAAESLGLMLDVPAKLERRETKISINPRNKKLVVKIKEDNQDPNMPGWIRDKKFHQLVTRVEIPEQGETELADSTDEIRHCVSSEGADAGWYVKGMDDNQWVYEPLSHVKNILSSLGASMKERERQVGHLVVNYWKLTNDPFQPEYPGNRVWNRNAAQFKYDLVEEEELHYPTWMKILDHCGSGLDEAVKEDEWCNEHGITNGASYLKCWIAAMFQEPREPLPYLFFFGHEDCGKSIFHEAISLLVTKGVGRIDMALTSSANFNSEIHGLILGVVEETNLGSKKNGTIINKIKDWVTSREVTIHAKGKTPFMVPNTMHVVQCSNDINAVPVFPGDSRVVVARVPDLVDKIPKKKLIEDLIDEAPHFLTELRNLFLPESPSRLRIPVITTKEKEALAAGNVSSMEQFISDFVHPCPGGIITLKELWHEFRTAYPEDPLTQFVFHKKLGTEFGLLKGRRSNADHCVGNVSLDPEEVPKKELVVINGFLKEA